MKKTIGSIFIPIIAVGYVISVVMLFVFVMMGWFGTLILYFLLAIIGKRKFK